MASCAWFASSSTVQFDVSLLQKLRAAQRVGVFTGAGISAESGIPTFRDSLTGLWSQYSPEELATPEALH
jgi:NAD-dependent deacetylase